MYKLKPEGLNAEDMELELIDFGLEELGEGTGENGEEILVVRCGFTDFGNMQNQSVPIPSLRHSILPVSI